MINNISKKDISFLIVGAHKCGTTWLADMLKQHPEVFIPEEKEIYYFNKNFFEHPELLNYNHKKPIKWYLTFFKDAKNHQILGEATPGYLDDEDAAQKIFEFNPNIKIIILLRDPKDRSISNYFFYLQGGVIKNTSFEKAIESHRMIIKRSMYFQHVKRYLDIFPKENVKIMLFDELIKDNKLFLFEIQNFLGIEHHTPENINEKSNVTGEPKFFFFKRIYSHIRYFVRKHQLHFINDLVRKTGLANLIENKRFRLKKTAPYKPNIKKETYLYLYNFFLEDINKLEALLGYDLSVWKEKKHP